VTVIIRVNGQQESEPCTRDGKFSPDVVERYQRNEKALLTSMLEMYVSGVSTRRVFQVLEEFCGKKCLNHLYLT